MANRRGMALLYLVLLLALAGVLAATGARKLGSVLLRAKTAETRRALEHSAGVITAWGAGKGRLPDAAEYGSALGGAALDAWNRPIVYAYDGNLALAAGGGVCGRSSSSISSAATPVAFVLVSGGADNAASTPGASGPFSGDLTGLASGSISSVVTLQQLQERAGCSGGTAGRLRVVNGELPKVCLGVNYSATLVGEGGVAPLTYTVSGLPAGLNAAGPVISGNTMAAPGSYPVLVTVTDSQLPAPNSVQRNYQLEVLSCP